MEKRWVIFIVLSLLLWTGNLFLMRWLQPPPVAQQNPPAVAADKEPGKENDQAAGAPNGEIKAADTPAKADGEKPADAAAEKPAGQNPAAENPAPHPAANPPAEQVIVPDEIYTLGSADPDSGFRLLVTLVNTGAAVKRVELNSPKYLDQEHRSGYLGHLDLDMPPKGQLGAVVRLVAPGTPAAECGLKPGDIITALNGEVVESDLTFPELLSKTSSDAEFSLDVLRDGKPQQLEGQFRRIPMQIIRPEGPDQLSFLATLESVDTEHVARDAEELSGVTMRKSNWLLVPGHDEQHISFQYDLPKYGLQVFKHFKLEKVDPAEADDPTAQAYDLQFELEVRNVGDKDRTVAWRLDGPTGLPLESTGYKISPNWFKSAGIRDVAVGFLRDGHTTYGLVSASTIAEDSKLPTVWKDEPLEFIAVDAQYFAVALKPHKDPPTDVIYSEAGPIRVGEVPAEKASINKTNVTFRIIGKPQPIAANGKPLLQPFDIFAGPKRPVLLRQYGLANLLHYGWFGWVAEPMLVVLHLFYSIIPNYGIAIILLTVLVRSAMFPLSRRQAANAAKMQELQPEIKRLQEKYKGNMEARTKAQQELFRKHNYSPLAGCLPVFLQLPIFIGLYRSLSVDVELRGAPLISQSVRWCSNLAAPDMLFKWQEYLPAILGGPNGFLGPWFNVLPCITIALFIWQQKMFMPPAADEQAAMQQKMMKYMMVFVGVMFFKVPSGLCLYFIASSLWGITERKLLPKAATATGGGGTTIDVRPIVPRSGGNGSGGAGGSKKKNRGRA
ncbi:MAG TPA: YidC/Oxa1 family insertase periplasmic-domain containing protein [Pirellulales bacterium]|jgi:YidC/Oxa1 family membrane protein insertase